MPRYPHSHVLHDPHRVVVISGPHIQVLDTHGLIFHSTASLPQEDREAVVRSGPVRCACTSPDGRFLATAGDDKQLKIWDLASLTLSSARALPKKPTSVLFSKNADILVSDKFGDVFRYTLHPRDERVQQQPATDALASHENPSNGELVLGHASLLTSCLLTTDDKFIITADRDEHIRVGWYPEGYVIESYCLGHRKYVSAIHIPAASPASLISGGGDPELKVWDWMTGRLQRNISVFNNVEPFIRVRPSNERHGPSEHEDATTSKGRKQNGGRRKQQKKTSLEPESDNAKTPSENANDSLSTTEPVFVVRKIDSFLVGGEHHVVFCAVGATALFEFVLTDADAQPDIRYRDFEKPVINFVVRGNGTIWVLLDADFDEESDVVGEQPRELVQVVQWSGNQFVDTDTSALQKSLNIACLLPATVADLKTLNLYADLSTLPKSVDGEQSTQGPDSMSVDAPVPGEATASSSSAVSGLTKRALGRLKHKRALDQLRQETMDGRDVDVSSPDAKKIKADSDNEDA